MQPFSILFFALFCAHSTAIPVASPDGFFDNLGKGLKDLGNKIVNGLSTVESTIVKTVHGDNGGIASVASNEQHNSGLPPNPDGCNGDPRYCQLRFDQYTFPATHDSLAVALKLDCDNSKGNAKTMCQIMDTVFSGVVYNCLWNNQKDHGIDQQLKDGIRNFDMRGCQRGNDVLFCHGETDTRALGQDLAAGFQQLGNFLQQNPGEIVSIMMSPEDGNSKVIMDAFVANSEKYLSPYLPTWDLNNKNWPTLGDMVKSGKRVVAFKRGDPTTTPGWLRPDLGSLVKGTWSYASNMHTASDMQKAISNYCNTATPSKQWQTLDVNFDPDMSTVEKEITSMTKPQVCIPEFTTEMNGDMMNLAQQCYAKFKFIHRVSVDNYWSTPVFDVVKWLNEQNLKLYIK